jgi:hypothetical protein
MSMNDEGPTGVPDIADRTDWRLHRWQVSFQSGDRWYPVGEYIAVDGPAAIERAIEVLGQGTAYRAEEIPWDAAPRSKAVHSRE